MSEDRWYPMAKIRIAKHDKFMGPGCRDLLTGIRKHRSVRLACEEMGLSYSKAWRLLNTLEEEAGYAVINRRQGGKDGGESTLTPEGERLLERFLAFERECTAAIEGIFVRHFTQEAGLNQ